MKERSRPHVHTQRALTSTSTRRQPTGGPSDHTNNRCLWVRAAGAFPASRFLYLVTRPEAQRKANGAAPYLLSSLLWASAPCWISRSSTSTGEVEGVQSSSAPPFAFFNRSPVFLLTK